jgi:hypothetical protein
MRENSFRKLAKLFELLQGIIVESIKISKYRLKIIMTCPIRNLQTHIAKS